MQNSKTGYCLILAGGIGSRLWPASREDLPKQFLDLFGTGRTLLQQTYDRYARFISPDHIYISTNEQYMDLIREQLPQVCDRQILAEPIRRGTLASVAWGALVIAARRDAQANIIVSPADQLIFDEAALQADIERGMNFVREQKALVTVGIRPTRPETGYGYIQAGAQASEGICSVKSFTEKPELEYAKMFVQTGEFYWNAGLFVFNVQSLLQALMSQVPEYQFELPKMLAELRPGGELRIPDFFSALPKRNIDYGILDGNDNVFVLEGHFGWADIGTWESAVSGATPDDKGNVMLDSMAVFHNSNNNIVRLPKGKKALISGLSDYVVADQEDVLVIYPKGIPSELRRLKTEAQMTMDVK